jgi:hypothetical protein
VVNVPSSGIFRGRMPDNVESGWQCSIHQTGPAECSA